MRDALLTVKEMYAADAAAMAQGIAGSALMENAGSAVADTISLRWGIRPVAVLCGPGNNGGDGFVAARILMERGWPVVVHMLGERSRLTGDAAHHAALWAGATRPLVETAAAGAGIVVDALFGAGLTRPVDGLPAAALRAIPADAAMVAVDVPSGVDGDSGQIQGFARKADVTVTFFRAKPGHFLLPGRTLRGELVIADIGMPASVITAISSSVRLNGPGVWGEQRPRLREDGHKFDRGHLSVVGGRLLTGAARLAARAGMYAGAGLVTVLAPPERADTYRSDLASLMVAEVGDTASIDAWLADERRNSVVVGPGLGREPASRRMVEAVLAHGRAAVIDGDGLSVFAGEAASLAKAIRGPCVLTPHAGEFGRVFGADRGEGRLTAARGAAGDVGAVVVLKGADTVIAAPDGSAAINHCAPPELAVAGSGDVLSGIIGAALAMGVEPFAAACLGVSVHAEAGRRMGHSSADALAEAVRPLWAADSSGLA